MEIKEACEIMDIDANDITLDNIKRQFRVKALVYHPDKNKSSDASEAFVNLTTAYELLSKHVGKPSQKPEVSYTTLMKQFVETISSNPIIQNLLDKLRRPIEQSILDSFDRMNIHTLFNIHCIIKQYAHIFQIDTTYIDRINEILKKHQQNLICYVLNPTMEDIINGSVYKLNHHEDTFFVPLWHYHMSFEDKHGDIFHVVCENPSSERMMLDEDNNVHLFIKASPKQFLNDGKITLLNDIYKDVEIYGKQIMLVKEQKVLIRGKGAPKIAGNESMGYNNTKGNLIVHLRLE